MIGRSARMLFIVYPSNFPNFGADSIYIFNRILIKSLLISYPNLKIMVIGPPEMPSIHPGVEFVPISLGTSKFAVRLNFPWDEIREQAKELRPDYCFVNLPEHAGTMAILFKDDLRLPCKIISFVHYLHIVPGDHDSEAVTYENSMNQNGHGPVLLARILEGVMASDLVLVNSNFALKLLVKGAQFLKWSLNLSHARILPPPVDLSEVQEQAAGLPANVPQFVYNHRLYDEYGTHKVFGLLERIYESGASVFEILVTNPTAGRDPERSRLNPAVNQNLKRIEQMPFVKVQHFNDRTSYMRALNSSWGGIAPYKPHALWSMSVLDLLASGRPVLSFDIASFREIGLPDDLLVKNDKEFISVFRRLMRTRPQDSGQRYRSIARQFSGEMISNRFMGFLAGF